MRSTNHLLYPQLVPYVDTPEVAKWCQEISMHYPFEFILAKERMSKLGDYKYAKSLKNERHQITVNHNLNPHQFLITFLHELAHRIVVAKYSRRVKPHGEEWKGVFSSLLNSAITQDFFPQDIKKEIVQHTESPKASVISDELLYFALKKYDKKTAHLTLRDIGIGQRFIFKKRAFKKLEKKRTRAICESLQDKKHYYISLHAEVVAMSS